MVLIVTLCHGDSKPDNFMFRRISIELGKADIRVYLADNLMKSWITFHRRLVWRRHGKVKKSLFKSNILRLIINHGKKELLSDN
jgi:hypothetical protein